MSPQLILAFSGTTTAIGIFALLAYLYTNYKISSLQHYESRSVRTLVEGDGLFNADQVIFILQTFSTDEARLEALKELARVQSKAEKGAERVYSKIKGRIDLVEIQKQRLDYIKIISKGVAPFLISIACITTAYESIKSAPFRQFVSSIFVGAADESSICQFNQGWHDYSPMTPLKVGASCQDGSGNNGVVIAPGRQSGKELFTSSVCQFSDGWHQYRPEQALIIGSACYDGKGNSGFIVAPEQKSGLQK